MLLNRIPAMVKPSLVELLYDDKFALDTPLEFHLTHFCISIWSNWRTLVCRDFYIY